MDLTTGKGEITIMDEKRKTPEEMREDLYKQVAAQGTEYMNEVAMPGLTIPVNPDDIKK